jgi:hypothetical protein
MMTEAAKRAYPALTDPACPWTPVREWGDYPNVKWCEETLCSWVAEPANTWSNLAFLAAAGVLYVLAREEKSRILRFFAPAAAVVGLSSGVYHASVTFLLQVFDFFGMYCFLGLLLMVNAVRAGWVAPSRFFGWFWGGVAGLTGLTVAVAKAGLPVQGIVLAMILGLVATEWAATRAEPGPVAHGWFGAALLTLCGSAALSAMDVSRTWCEPTNHWVQGHAVWHLLNGVAMCLAYVFYRQFRSRLEEDAGGEARVQGG